MPEIHIDSAPMILFCHFCEIHGPSIVFSTCMTKFYSFDQYNDSLNHLINSKKKSICEGCSLIQKNDQILKTNYSQQSTSSRKLQLASPNPFNGYITYDEDDYFHYITTDEPLCYKSQAKHSCVRSLSCETYPGDKEGTIYYGDDYRWHHLSWMFVLQDEQARGFSRTYSIIISQSRKYDLITNWSKFSQYVYKIINLLKTKSRVTFERESTVSKDTKPNFNRPSNMSSSSLGYPQKMNTNFMDKVHRSQIDDGSIRPAPFRRTTKEARSLVDLTGDTSIFSYMHENFCLILKLVSQARLELLAVTSVYQNNSFKLHNTTDHHQASTSSVGEKSGSHYRQNFNLTNKKYALTLRHLYKFLDKDKFETLTYSLITGGLIVLICDNSNLLLQIILCIIQILPEERASWQIVSQQDIVSSSSQSQSSSKESSSTSSSVSWLEENQQNNPKDSSQNISSTETLTTDITTHHHRRRSISVERSGHSNNSPIFLKTKSEYNILGFTNSYDFKKKKLAYTVLINMLQCDDKASFVQKKQLGTDNLLEVSANYELQKYKVTLHSKLKKTNTCKLPHYQTKLTQALLSLDVSDKDFQLYLENLKQEWSIYARIASSMTMVHNKYHSTVREQEYQARRESNLMNASTSTSSSSNRNQQHEFRHQIDNNRPNSGNENVLAQNLYNLLNISDSDMKLFEFWA